MITNYNLKLGHKFWLEFQDDQYRNSIIGENKIELLKKIDETGSIQKASDEIGLDFKKAHEILNDLQESFGDDILFTTERGRQGGTTLSMFAKLIIDVYSEIASALNPIIQKLNDDIKSKTIDNPDFHVE